MDLQQLRYIVALSQELHFLKAARRVNVSQPTLSQQIKKLEEELGVFLFERSPQQVKLTDSGEKFLPYAIQVLDSLEKGVGELQEETGEVTGRIRVAAIPTICPYLLPSVITKIRKKAPRLVLEIYEETTSVLVEHLKDGKLDLGILALPIPDPGIVSRTLGKETFYLAVSKNHPLAKKNTVRPKDIEKERLLVLQEGHCFRNQSLEFCKKQTDDIQVIFQGSSLTSVMKLASSGEGITFVPKMAADFKEYPDLKFIPFASPQPTRELGFVWRISAPLSSGHRLFMSTVEEVHKLQSKK